MAGWMNRLKTGTKSNWYNLFKIPGVDWSSPNALTTPIDKEITDKMGFAGKCIAAHSKILLLHSKTPPPLENLMLSNNALFRINAPTLHPIPRTGTPVAEGSVASMSEAAQYTSSNPIDLFKLRKVTREGGDLVDKAWGKMRGKITTDLFGKPNAKSTFPPEKDVSTKDYGLTSFRSRYRCILSVLRAPVNPFRLEVDTWSPAGAGQDWIKIDKLFKKLTLDTRTRSFLWRSTHNLLYTNKNKFKFKFVASPACHLCDNGTEQSDAHLWSECWRVSQLFDRFCIHYDQPPLNKTEKRLGIDTADFRGSLITKKLNILRMTISEFNGRGKIPRWDHFEDRIKRIVDLEYAIAEAKDRTELHLRLWKLHGAGDKVV
jgi:hypothetical protein